MYYTIINIDDRSKVNIEKIKQQLVNFTLLEDIDFCDGNKVDAQRIIESMQIPIRWNPYDGRSTPPLKTEYGVWLSNINIYLYIIKNKINNLLVLEDDVVLSEDFASITTQCLEEVPKNFDFISLYSSDEKNIHFFNQNKITNESDINLKYLHKAINQKSFFQGVIFSNTGAQKIIKLLKKEGIQYTNDTQVFQKCAEGKLNGYSLKPNYKIIYHDTSIMSVIDPLNYRFS